MRRMFSQKQIEELIREHLLTSDLKVKTLEQSEPNWEVELEPSLSSSASDKGLTLTPIYNKLQLINGILYLVLINSIENPTESSISIGTGDTIQVSVSGIPEEISSRIYDFAGKKVSESGTDRIDLNRSPAGIQTGVGYSQYRLNTTHNNANSISFSLEREIAYNINAGSKSTITARNFYIVL